MKEMSDGTMRVLLHIGIDDTDSPQMGCTTYVGSLLVEHLIRLGVYFVDYPNIIRLNPNVPWKTRGNGAVCLRFLADENLLDKIQDIALEVLDKQSDLSYRGTDPGIVFYQGEVASEISNFARRAIQGLVTFREALQLIKAVQAEAVGYNKCRGIIGALAAIGELLHGDHTFELIAYRHPKNWGTPRKINYMSVVRMDKLTKPLTYNNIDPETKRILITPRGPDPVLYGIRGETPEIVWKASQLVEAEEEIERWTIFRTNQGTDMHLRQVRKLSLIRPYQPVIARGVVTNFPQTIPGGHVIFSLQDSSGEVDCAAYEPTGSFREIIRQLAPKDVVRVYGGVRPASPTHSRTINLEKIKILSLARTVKLVNPSCPTCGKRLKSVGSGKGFRCNRCGFKTKETMKNVVEIPRGIKTGLYMPPPRAQRHLTRPLSRHRLKRREPPTKLFEPWHWP
jgi:tRNA(Ile2)-agmatinylcytidine synthase